MKQQSKILLQKSFLIILINLCILVLGAIPAHADMSVSLETDRTQARVGESISLTVRVKGSQKSALPSISGLESFRVESAGTSSSFQFINGQMSSSVDYNYTLLPKKEGVFTIGPAEVEVAGKTYASSSVSVTISQQPRGDQSPADGEDMLAISRISPEKTYPGQTAVYTLTFYYSVNIRDVTVNLPEGTGLTFKQIGGTSEYMTTHQGKQYRVAEIAYNVSAPDPGNYTVPPVALRMNIIEQRRSRSPLGGGGLSDNFFGMMQARPASIESNAVAWSVLPFPDTDRPVDFGGLVGQFTMNAALDPKKIKAGESATLTVSVKGKGNAQLLPDLKLPDMEGVKIYPDQPQIKTEDTREGTQGEKTMKWAIVPQREGKIPIPSLQISFFDPRTQQYQTAGTEPLNLDVEAGDTGAGEPQKIVLSESRPAKKDVELIGQDILPNHISADDLLPPRGQTWGAAAKAALFFIPILPFGCILLVKRIREKTDKEREKTAARKAVASFSKSIKSFGQGQSSDLLKALQTYFKDRLHLQGSTITAAEARQRLQQLGVDENAVATLHEVFIRLEASVFAGNTEIDMDAWKHTLTDVLKKIDKRLPNSGRKGMGTVSGISLIFLLGFMGILFISSPSLLAQDPGCQPDPHALFFAANEAFGKGEYQQAAELFESLIAQGPVGGSVYYNLGNCYLKFNQLGKAILNYERARIWMPRDPDLDFNLRYAKNKRVDEPEKDDSFSFTSMMQWLSPVEIFWVFFIIHILFCAILTLRLWHRSEWSFYLMAALMLMWGVMAFCSGFKWIQYANDDRGVVLAEKIDVRAGPDARDTLLFQLHSGTIVTCEREESDWRLVRFSADKRGWIPKSDAALVRKKI